MKEIIESKAFLCVIATVCILVLLKVIGSMTHNAMEYLKTTDLSRGSLNDTNFDFEIDQNEENRRLGTVGEISKNLQKKSSY